MGDVNYFLAGDTIGTRSNLTIERADGVSPSGGGPARLPYPPPFAWRSADGLLARTRSPELGDRLGNASKDSD